ncbi:MAG: patatin-like phospholipase family protein [Lewinella sp.]|nr:patatin-like phospholipase family protein [Lewinella sp.]
MRLLSLLLLFPLFVSMAVAQPSPRIGLTLSGGGAKGLAHIGVLQVLEEAGIVPDYVSGTSMGSIVGGLYSIGYTPAELDSLARGLVWSDYFSDTYSRALQPIEEREQADRYQLTLAWEDGGPQLPRGLIAGKKIETLLDGLTAPVHDQLDFDRFYRPFRCVATDLADGSAYVYRSGPLRRAIRASMAIPSAFEPLDDHDHLLVDGMLARNLPVQDVKDMGAAYVIAVDVGDPLYPREELNSVLKVLEQTSSFGMARSTDKQRALADFLIDPELTPYSALSYEAADSLIARGRQAAEAALPALLDSLRAAGYTPHPAPPRPPWRRDSFRVQELAFAAGDEATERLLAQLVVLELPRVLTLAELNRQVDQLYATGFFRRVDYELQRATGGYRLLWSADPGPRQYLRGSIGYDSDQRAAFLFNLTTRNRLLRGSVLSLDLRVSEFPAAWLKYDVYTRSSPSIGLQWRLQAEFSPGLIYREGELESEFTFHQYRSSLALQSGLGEAWHLSFGLGLEHLAQHPRFITLGDGEAQLNQWYGFFQLLRDRYDRTYFPTRGSQLRLWGRYTFSGELQTFGEEESRQDLRNNVLLAARYHRVVPLHRRWWLDLRAGLGVVNYRERHLLNLFYLGREMPGQYRTFELYGLRLMEQPSSGFGYGGLQLRTEIGQRNFIGLGYNWGYYVLSDYGFISEGGNFQEPETKGYFQGVGLELGSLTTLGPLRLTVEYNPDRRRMNYSFYAGYRF